MKTPIQLMTGLLLFSTLVFSQNARVQIIHDSPSATVDVYANGTKLLNDFAFRTATPFMDLPAGVTINLGIGLATSQSVRDTSVNFPVVLEAGKRYVIATIGAIGNTQQPFQIAINDMGLETASTPTHVGIGFFHGSQNTSDVDILTDSSTLFDNISYTKFGKYINAPANATHRLSLTSAMDNYTILARYERDLSFWTGKTVVIFTSGITGSTDPNTKFETWVALSNGGTFPLTNLATTPPVRQARLQVIHNSPTDTLDIYINGNKFIDNLSFRSGTPYISVPGNVTLNFGVARASSTSPTDIIANFPIRLDSGKTYIAITHGAIGHAQKPFGIAVTDPFAAREVSSNPNNVDVNFFNGTFDIPAIDVLSGNAIFFDSVRYARFGDNISLPANATYRLKVTPGDNNINIGEYDLNLSNWKGKSAFIIATGFLSGGTTPFQPWVVLSSGFSYPLNPVSGAIKPDIFMPFAKKVTPDFETYPNPAKEFVIFDFKLENDAYTHFQIINMNGQIVAERRMGKLEIGQQQLTINTKNFNSGIYIVRMITDNEIKTKKLMIER
jgi:Secretion system C-terminal sorting domain/Domain of unknown function (DUF4397)